MINFVNRHPALRWIALLVLFVMAVPSVLEGAQKAIYNSCDFQHDWVAARLVVAGQDIYRPFLSTEADSLYPQGDCTLPLSRRPPLDTPLLAVALIPIQGWDWGVVKVFWLIVQIVSAVGLTAVVVEMQGNLSKHRAYLVAFLTLMMFGWLSFRLVLTYGQPSLITALLGFLAIWFGLRKQSTWAGVFLGLALWKFSMVWALPVFFIVYRQYRAVVIAGLMQLAALLIVALSAHTSPFIILSNYVTLMSQWTAQNWGVVSISRWVQLMGMSGTSSTVLLLGLGTVLVIWVVWTYYRRELLGQAVDGDPVQAGLKANILVVVLILISMMFIYHRSYDLVALMVYFAFVASLFELPHRTPAQERVLAMLMRAGLLIWLSHVPPPTLAASIFPDSADISIEIFLTASVLAALAVAVWGVAQLSREPMPKRAEGEQPAVQEVQVKFSGD